MEPVLEPPPSPPEPARASEPGAQVAATFFAVALVSFLVAGSLAQISNVPFGLIWTEVFLFALPSWLWVRRHPVSAWEWLRMRRPRACLILLGFLCGLANYPLAGALEAMVRVQVAARWPHFAKQSDIAAATLGAVHGWQVVVLVAGVGLVAPLCEEMAFRGLILRAFGRALKPTQAVALTAFLFAFIHLEPVGGLARFELGVLFGALVLWTGSLWTSVAAHAANNLFATALFLTAGHAGDTSASTSPGSLQLLGLGVMGAGLVVPLLVLVHSLRTPELPVERDVPGPDRRAVVAWIATGLVSLVILIAVGVHSGAFHRAAQMAR